MPSIRVIMHRIAHEILVNRARALNVRLPRNKSKLKALRGHIIRRAIGTIRKEACARMRAVRLAQTIQL